MKSVNKYDCEKKESVYLSFFTFYVFTIILRDDNNENIIIFSTQMLAFDILFSIFNWSKFDKLLE